MGGNTTSTKNGPAGSSGRSLITVVRAERQDSGEAESKRLAQEKLQKLGWTKAELVQHRQGTHRPAVVMRDDDDAGLDREASALGSTDVCLKSATGGGRIARGKVSVNSEDCPLHDPSRRIGDWNRLQLEVAAWTARRN